MNPEINPELVGNPDFGNPDMELGSVTEKLSYRLNDFWNVGLPVNQVMLGFVAGSLYPAQNGILLGYLNMEGYLFRSSKLLWESPRILMVIFGILSDSRPIRGRRRGPYMVIGWALMLTAICILSVWPLPEPYYCVDPDGSYRFKEAPCNPHARHEYAPFVLLFAVICLGQHVSLAAANGLYTEYGKAEAEAVRGTTQTYMLMARKCGEFAAVGITAFAFNGKMYNGGWDQRYQLSFRELCRILIIPSAMALLTSAYCVRESTNGTKQSAFSAQAKSAWSLMSKKAFFYVAVWTVAGSVVNLGTPAGYFVSLEWAGVKTMQVQLSSLLGILTTWLGLFIFKKYFLDMSWRKLIVVKTFACIAIDSIPTLFTIFDVIRNQYFYLGEPLLDHVITAGLDVQNMLLTNEVADEDNAGLVGGLLATMYCLSSPFGGILSNQLFGLFTPSLSNRDNFIADTWNFRLNVAMSFFITWGFSIASLSLLHFMPRQKLEAQERKKKWPSSSKFAYATAICLAVAFLYQMTVEVMSLDEKLACMKFVGGEGC